MISKPYRIVYAAMNDADLMVEVFRHLATIGVDADLAFDRRSKPEEAAILQAAGIPFEFIDNEHGFVEGVYGKIAARTREEWVFILTSDEIPTRAGLAAIEQAIESAPSHVNSLGFARQWVIQAEDGAFCTSQAAFMGFDHQWRIIRHRDVNFRPVVHTPGYDLEDERRQCLDAAAAVYHFDWVVHSRQLRERKLTYYDGILPGAVEIFRKWYLPEDYLSEHDLMSLDAARGAGICVPGRAAAK